MKSLTAQQMIALLEERGWYEDRQALINYWESQNDKLRNLGIRPLTLESLE